VEIKWDAMGRAKDAAMVRACQVHARRDTPATLSMIFISTQHDTLYLYLLPFTICYQSRVPILSVLSYLILMHLPHLLRTLVSLLR